MFFPQKAANIWQLDCAKHQISMITKLTLIIGYIIAHLHVHDWISLTFNRRVYLLNLKLILNNIKYVSYETFCLPFPRKEDESMIL